MSQRLGLMTAVAATCLCCVGLHAQTHGPQPTGAPLTMNGNSYMYPVTGNSGAQQGAAIPQRPGGWRPQTMEQQQTWRSGNYVFPARQHAERPRGIGDAESPEMYEHLFN